MYFISPFDEQPPLCQYKHIDIFSKNKAKSLKKVENKKPTSNGKSKLT